MIIFEKTDVLFRNYRHTYSDDIEENIFSDGDYFTTITIKIHEQEYNENFETINEFEIGVIEVLL